MNEATVQKEGRKQPPVFSPLDNPGAGSHAETGQSRSIETE